jgi:hypothetical protein
VPLSDPWRILFIVHRSDQFMCAIYRKTLVASQPLTTLLGPSATKNLEVFSEDH